MIIPVYFCQDKECKKVVAREYKLTARDICECTEYADPVECLTEKVLDQMARQWCGVRSKACIEGYKSAQGEAARPAIERAVSAALREMAMRFGGVSFEEE